MNSDRHETQEEDTTMDNEQRSDAYRDVWTLIRDPLIWVLVVFGAFIAIMGLTRERIKTTYNPTQTSYSKGFNDALDSITLLNLELKFKGERRTFGEMADILRDRHNVPEPDDSIYSQPASSGIGRKSTYRDECKKACELVPFVGRPVPGALP